MSRLSKLEHEKDRHTRRHTDTPKTEERSNALPVVFTSGNKEFAYKCYVLILKSSISEKV